MLGSYPTLPPTAAIGFIYLYVESHNQNFTEWEKRGQDFLPFHVAPLIMLVALHLDGACYVMPHLPRVRSYVSVICEICYTHVRLNCILSHWDCDLAATTRDLRLSASISWRTKQGNDHTGASCQRRNTPWPFNLCTIIWLSWLVKTLHATRRS